MSRTPITRIALVRYSRHGKACVAKCPRRDIGVGAQVQVIRHDGERLQAEVVAIQHEGWHCSDQIRQLADEADWGFKGLELDAEPQRPAVRPTLRLVRSEGRVVKAGPRAARPS